MNVKILGAFAAVIILVAGVGYAVTNPHAFAGLADSLKGQATSTEPAAPAGATVHLVMDGADIGPVQNFRGCGRYAPVITEWDGMSAYSSKRLGTPAAETCSFDIALGASRPILQWMNEQLTRPVARSMVFYIAEPGTTTATRQVAVDSAVLVEVVYPQLDGSSMSYPMTFTIQPAAIREGPAKLSLAATKGQGLAQSFRLEVDGLDLTGAGRPLVSPIAIRAPMPATSNEFRSSDAYRNVMNFNVTLQDTKAVADWVDAAFAGRSAERALTLTFLDGQGLEVHRLQLTNVAPHSYDIAAGAARASHRVGLYAEAAVID